MIKLLIIWNSKYITFRHPRVNYVENETWKNVCNRKERIKIKLSSKDPKVYSLIF